MTEKVECYAHVRPQPQDPTPPVPLAAVTARDLVEFRACSAGFGAMCQRANGQRPSLYDFMRGVEIMKEYIRTWERRTALDDVL